ncbi:membrane protease subunit HflK [Peribacillus simplex]|nr:membrane protease subunit HflK [Peribacillus simplex]
MIHIVSLKRIYTIIGLVFLILILGVVAISTWYTVDESDQAVIMTFGKVEQTITEPGLHFKLPWPIQSVEKLSKETFSLKFGYKEEDGEVKDYPSETKMITGDENIVLADLVVQWKITDPPKYLYNADDPEKILYDTTSAALRSIIGSTKIDDALTSGKAQIEADVWGLLSQLMEKYDVGISISAVKLQDVELPNEEVRKAFTNVTDARETANTKINEADKYENKRMNEAEGEKDAIISQANGDKAARTEAARGDVAVFEKLLSEYKGNKGITKDRLVIETLEEVLPNAELYIMNDDGNTMKYLPLRSLEKEETKKMPAPDESTAPEGETEKGNATEEKAAGEGGAKQ